MDLLQAFFFGIGEDYFSQISPFDPYVYALSLYTPDHEERNEPNTKTPDSTGRRKHCSGCKKELELLIRDIMQAKGGRNEKVSLQYTCIE